MGTMQVPHDDPHDFQGKLYFEMNDNSLMGSAAAGCFPGPRGLPDGACRGQNRWISAIRQTTLSRDDPSADILPTGRRIPTRDAASRRAAALAVRENPILAVGSDDTA